MAFVQNATCLDLGEGPLGHMLAFGLILGVKKEAFGEARWIIHRLRSKRSADAKTLIKAPEKTCHLCVHTFVFGHMLAFGLILGA